MIQTEGGHRLRVTLLDRMSAVESGRSLPMGLTLDAVLRADKRDPQPPSLPHLQQLEPASSSRNHPSRTLLDVMREEHRHCQNRDKTTWKSFRDKLRLKRATAAAAAAAAAWTSSDPIPAADIRVQDNEGRGSNRLGFFLSNSGDSVAQTETTHHRNSADAGDRAAGPMSPESVGGEGRLRLGVVLAEERALSAREAEAPPLPPPPPPPPPPPQEVQPPRMSLMELLEETDQQVGLAVENVEEVEEEQIAAEEEEEEERHGEGTAVVVVAAEESRCCVCMIRSKGAAFIPCGHTFCRLCSRELWVQRGSCPLCNASIVEILDIF